MSKIIKYEGRQNIEINYDTWFDMYQPYSEDNQIKHYETYGADWDFIKSIPQVNVWTVLDRKYIINGRHLVNRLLYIVSTLPWDRDQHIQVQYE